MQRERPIRTVIHPGYLALAPVLLALALPVAAGTVLDRAEADWEAGQAAKALTALGNLLQQEPSDLAARLLLSRVQLDLGQAAAAQDALDKVWERVESGETLPPAVLTELPLVQAQVSLQLGQPSAVLELDLPEGVPAARRADLLAWKGEALLNLRRRAEAESAFASALALDPGNVQVRLGEFASARARGDLPRARRRLAEALELDPRSSAGWLALCRLELQQGNLDAAAAACSRAIDLGRRKAFALYQRARVHLAAGDPQAARADLEAAAPDLPRSLALQLTFAEVHLALNDPATALEHLETVLRSAPGQPEALRLAGTVHRRLRNWEQATAMLERYRAGAPGDPRGVIAQAELALDREDPAAAEALLAPLAATLKKGPLAAELLKTRARALSALGRAQEADALRVSAKDPAFLSARERVADARARLTAGAPGEAAAVLESVLQQNPGYREVLPLLVEAHLAAGNPAAALAAAESLTAEVPESSDALQLLALARLAARQPGPAREALEKAWTLDPRAVVAAVHLAALQTQAGHLKRARAVLDESLAKLPGQPDLILALVDLDRREGRPESARTRLERALAERPEALRLRLRLVSLALADGDPQGARKRLDELPPASAGQPPSPMLIRLRGETALANGERDAAWAFWKTLLDGDPRPATLTEVGGYALRLGRVTDALPLYRQAVAADPKDWMALNNLAMLTLVEDPVAALGLAERAWAAHPGYASVADTLASTLLALGTRDPATALQAARRLEAASPRNPLLVFALGSLLAGQGERPEALRLLGAAHAAHPAEPRLAFRYAEILADSGDAAAAVKVLKGLDLERSFPERAQAKALRERLGNPAAGPHS